MEAIKCIIDFILHADNYLIDLVTHYGIIVYLIVFLIIFIETGMVIAPFLPGDSLIFAVGTLSAIGCMNIYLSFLILASSAILGDSINYIVGSKFGRMLLAKGKLIKVEHVEKTEIFYAKYGARAIVLARFMPIIRTFIPFVAGIGSMHYKKFVVYNIIGGISWVLIFLLAGFFFGNVPFVNNNFEFVIIVIVFISLLPGLFVFIREKLKDKKKF